MEPVGTNYRHSVSVAAVVPNDAGDVLMIKRRDNGKWEPPGGVLEFNEPILDGLRREVLEETGLQIAPDQLTGVYKNMMRGIIALVFRASPSGGHLLKETEESRRVEWVPIPQIKSRCDEAYAIRFLDALTTSGPFVRQHDGIRLI
jgi:8-oxo-dGTP diphosphatase